MLRKVGLLEMKHMCHWMNEVGFFWTYVDLLYATIDRIGKIFPWQLDT